MDEIIDISERTPGVMEGILEAIGDRTSEEIKETMDYINMLLKRRSYILPIVDVEEDQLNKITNLDLSDKEIEVLKMEDFDGLMGMVRLNLRGNGLKDLPNNIFDGLDNLEEVNLEKNNFNESSIKKLTNLFKKIKLNFVGQVQKNIDKSIGIGD